MPAERLGILASYRKQTGGELEQRLRETRQFAGIIGRVVLSS
ncbi:MAG: hypothetical protein AB1507_00775 [Bacillota bacterium]|nr:hypothetical protein [Thermoanaerobacteraceae bacterium]